LTNACGLHSQPGRQRGDLFVAAVDSDQHKFGQFSVMAVDGLGPVIVKRFTFCL
jgi:hypothetical protein